MVAGCLLLSSCDAQTATNSAVAHSDGRPNIVFVLTDDLAMNLLPYMPRVQQMQRQGTSFADYFVTDSLCCPSRSTTFTGRFPHNTGVFTNGGNDGGYQVFNDRGNQNNTFATTLRAAGYRTAMMGKYLNGYEPQDPVPPGWSEWDVAGNGYPEFNYTLNENGHLVNYGNSPSDYLTDVLSRKAQGFIDQSAGKPFMLEVATFAPHKPYTPAPRDANKFPGLQAPRGPAFNEADMSDKPPWIKNHKLLTERQIGRIDNTFRMRAQAVQAVDDLLGNIEATLKARGIERDTYVVFSSDNGYHLGEHRLAEGKMTAYDTDIHVPLIIDGPGVAAGRTTNALTENTDLAPTFEDLAGANVPGNVDGGSLTPLLKTGSPGPDRDAVLVEHHGPDTLAGDPDRPVVGSGNPPSYEAVRTAHEVYVEYTDGEREYYDLRRDPNELRNAVTTLPATRLNQLSAMLHNLEHCSGKNCL